MFGAPVYNQFLPLTAFPQRTNGANIPMIGDKPPNLPPEPKRTALPDIPPTPHPGLPSTGGLNWNIVAACSHEEIAKTNDVKTIEALLNSFLNSRFTNTEAQLLPNPLAAKFYRLLQIGVQYIYDTQEHLRKILKQSDEDNKSLKEKLRTVTAAVSHLKNKVGKKPGEGSEKCIVCHRVFKSLEYLDGHMQRRHAALVPAWKSLRSGHPQGLEDITDQITNLRQAISKTRTELSHAVADHNDVRHIVEQPDMQLRALVELNEKQDRLIEQQNNQDRAQMNFRREIRNQLDSAIVQLRQSARRMEEKISNPSMPPMPTPEFIKHDLEMSLTQQLVMKQNTSGPRISFPNLSLSSLSNNPQEVINPPIFPSQLKELPPHQNPIQIQGLQKPPNPIQKQETPTPTAESIQKLELPKTGFVSNPVMISKSPQINKNKERENIEFNFDTANDKPPVIPHYADGETPFQVPPQVLQPRIPPVKDEISESEISSARPVTGDMVFSMLEPIEKSPAKINGVKKTLIDRARAIINKPMEYRVTKQQNDKYVSEILREVTEQLDKLRQMRPYAPPTDVYASKVLSTGKKEYLTKHDELLIYLEKLSPIEDVRVESLFANRQMTFPLAAPKRKPVLTKEMQRKFNQDIGFARLQDQSPSKVPQNTHRRVDRRANDLLEPDSSDIIPVSNFETSETSSEPVPGIFEDPYYYGKPKPEKVYKPITKVETSSSAIQPVSDSSDGLEDFKLSDNETKEDKIDEFFADSKEKVEEKSESSTKSKKSSARSSVSSVSSSKSKSVSKSNSKSSVKSNSPQNKDSQKDLRGSNTAMMTDSSSSTKSKKSQKSSAPKQELTATTTTVKVTKMNMSDTTGSKDQNPDLHQMIFNF